MLKPITCFGLDVSHESVTGDVISKKKKGIPDYKRWALEKGSSIYILAIFKGFPLQNNTIYGHTPAITDNYLQLTTASNY